MAHERKEKDVTKFYWYERELLQWRKQKAQEVFQDAFFRNVPFSIMLDTVLKLIATRAEYIKDEASMQAEIRPPWPGLQRYGAELLQIIRKGHSLSLDDQEVYDAWWNGATIEGKQAQKEKSINHAKIAFNECRNAWLCKTQIKTGKVTKSQMNKCDPEVLIKRFSWRSNHIMASMIRVQGSIRPIVLSEDPESISIGALDTMSTELLCMIFNLLDIQSLSRFARVCRRGKRAVEFLPAYRDLTKHASTALIALNQTKLITAHPIAFVYTACLSESCIACKNYGPFLFLPTCERCCSNCLREDHSLWVISSDLARICFGVFPQDLCQIPAVWTLLGAYGVDPTAIREKPAKLFSLKMVKNLGIAIHGSQLAMDEFVWNWNTVAAPLAPQ